MALSGLPSPPKNGAARARALVASLTVALDPESALQEAIELKARGESGHLAEATRLFSEVLDEVAHGLRALFEMAARSGSPIPAPTRFDALHHLSVMHHEAGENERALALVDEAERAARSGPRSSRTSGTRAACCCGRCGSCGRARVRGSPTRSRATGRTSTRT